MRRAEHGMTLVETLVALALLGVGILMAGSVVIWSLRIEERADRRAAALELAASVGERLRAAPYGLVHAGVLDLSGESLPAVLEEPSVELEVSEDLELGIKRVRVIVAWAGLDDGRFVLETAVGRGELYR